MKTLIVTTVLALLVWTTSAFPASLFAGYAGVSWGTDIHHVVQQFSGGEMGKMGEMVVYKQTDPNARLRQRLFGFEDNKLKAVSVTFAAAYVKKVGLEKLLAEHKKAYGEGTADQSQAPHMVTYTWESDKSRIVFMYVPGKPEMTVVNYTPK